MTLHALNPRRAAAGGHKGRALGLAFGPLGGLGNGGVIAAAGHFVDRREADLAQGGVELSGLGGEEAIDGGGD